MTFRLC